MVFVIELLLSLAVSDPILRVDANFYFTDG